MTDSIFKRMGSVISTAIDTNIEFWMCGTRTATQTEWWVGGGTSSQVLIGYETLTTGPTF